MNIVVNRRDGVSANLNTAGSCGGGIVSGSHLPVCLNPQHIAARNVWILAASARPEALITPPHSPAPMPSIALSETVRVLSCTNSPPPRLAVIYGRRAHDLRRAACVCRLDLAASSRSRCRVGKNEDGSERTRASEWYREIVRGTRE